MDLGSNPFGMLTFIVAPSILTNASSILALSTSNRLGRVIDRARALSSQVEKSANAPDVVVALQVRELESTERRASIVVRALTAFYVSVGSFAAVGLLSLVGVVSAVGQEELLREIVTAVVLCFGVVGVGGLVGGAGMLAWETRLALHDLAMETEFRLKQRHSIDERGAHTRIRGAGVTAP
jgi:hypothetical protein